MRTFKVRFTVHEKLDFLNCYIYIRTCFCILQQRSSTFSFLFFLLAFCYTAAYFNIHITYPQPFIIMSGRQQILSSKRHKKKKAFLSLEIYHSFPIQKLYLPYPPQSSLAIILFHYIFHIIHCLGFWIKLAFFFYIWFTSSAFAYGGV